MIKVNCVIACIVLICSMSSSFSAGQDDADEIKTGTVVETTADFARNLIVTTQLEKDLTAWSADVQTENPDFPVVMWHFDRSLASGDGEYLAQSPSELQTYYDLGMTYKFIESPLVRTQLRLNDEEGILINTTTQDGMGYEMGFREGDLVLTIQEQPVDTQYDFVIAVDENRGDETSAQIKRAGVLTNLSFKLQPADEEKTKRWIIGVSVQEMDEILRAHLKTEGIIITSVTKDGPAAKMGLQQHDVVTAIDNQDITSTEDLRAAVQKSQGEDVTLKLIRNGGRMTVTLKPVEQPSSQDPWLATSTTRFPAIRYSVTPRFEFAQPHALAITDLALPQNSETLQESDSTDSEIDKVLKQIDKLREQVESLKNREK